MQTQIDYGKALSWYIHDPKFWPVVLTMSLYMISCIFILPMFYVLPLFTGYTIAQIRKIQRGEYEILDLDSSYWNDGMKLLLVGLAVGIGATILMMVFMFGPSVLLTTVASQDSGSGIAMFAIVMQLFGYVVQMLFSFGFPFLMLMAYAIYAKTNTLGSMFLWGNYRTVLRNNGWGVVVGYLVYYAGTVALTTLGMFACCVGILPASVAVVFIMAGVAGQLGVEGVEG